MSNRNFIVFHSRSDMPIPTNNGKPWFTLMADFGNAWGWELPPMSLEEASKWETGVGSLAAAVGDPDIQKELGISDELLAGIEAWQDRYEEWDPYAQDQSKYDWDAFDKTGLELARRLKAEIGNRYNVRYHFQGSEKCGKNELV